MTDINNLGLGVMIGMLGGNEASVKAFQGALGKTIAAVTLEENALRFTMGDGYRFKLTDEGQSCCESRYMRTDDDLAYHAGAALVSAEVREAPNEPDEFGEHEVAFLVVTTSRGAFTVASHNEHNGYYGGFWIQASPDGAA